MAGKGTPKRVFHLNISVSIGVNLKVLQNNAHDMNCFFHVPCVMLPAPSKLLPKWQERSIPTQHTPSNQNTPCALQHLLRITHHKV